MILDPLSVLALFFFLAASFLLGDFFSRRFLSSLDPLLRGIISVALGSGIIGYFLIFLGTMGQLSWLPATLFIGSVLLLGIRKGRGFLEWLHSLFSYLFKREEGAAVSFFRSLFVLVASATFLFCFLPEVAHDSLVYHINLPKIYAQTASMRTQEYDLMTYRPMLLECLFSLAFLFKCLPLAKLMHWLTGFLLTVGLIKVIEDETRSYVTALFFGLMLLITPMFVNEIQTTYTDVGAAFFAFTSFLLFLQGMEKKRPAFYLLSGVLMGLAISTKLLTILAACGMAMAFPFCASPENPKSFVRIAKYYLQPLFLFCLGFSLSFGYWCVRNAILTGDPFYPYFAGHFGLPIVALEQEFIQGGVRKTLINFILLPILMEFSPKSFDQHNYIGPFFLISYGLMFAAFFRSVRARFAAIVIGCVLVIWFFLCQNYRYLLPVMPLLFYAAAIGFVHLKENGWFSKLFKKLVILGSLASLFFTLVIGIYHFRGHIEAVCCGWSPAQYLTAMEQTTDIATWINRHLPADSKVLSIGEIRAFYFDRAFVGGDIYAIKHPEIFKMTGDAILKQVKQQGFTHLLVRWPPNGAAGTADAAAANPPWAALVNVRNGLREIYHLESRNIREKKFIYELFQFS